MVFLLSLFFTDVWSVLYIMGVGKEFLYFFSSRIQEEGGNLRREEWIGQDMIGWCVNGTWAI